MSVRRRAAKRDENEPDVIRALRRVGATVWQVSEKGLPDLVVGWRGATYLLEVKMPGKGLTEDQGKVHESWRGAKIHVVETPEAALRVIGLDPPAPHRPWTPEELAELLPPPRRTP